MPLLLYSSSLGLFQSTPDLFSTSSVGAQTVIQPSWRVDDRRRTLGTTSSADLVRMVDNRRRSHLRIEEGDTAQSSHQHGWAIHTPSPTHLKPAATAIKPTLALGHQATMLTSASTVTTLTQRPVITCKTPQPA